MNTENAQKFMMAIEFALDHCIKIDATYNRFICDSIQKAFFVEYLKDSGTPYFIARDYRDGNKWIYEIKVIDENECLEMIPTKEQTHMKGLN